MRMASTLFSNTGRCLAVLALVLCFQGTIAGLNCSESCRSTRDPTSTSSKQFILVHGMGGGAWFWYEIITMLEHFGHKATAVDLTSHGINKDVADEITTVAQYTKPLIDAINEVSGEVILVGHSLGGGSIAYASELFPNKVIKAIYLSAVIPSYNQSMFSAFPSNTFPNLINAGHVTLNFKNGPNANPTSTSLNINTLQEFYMSETPKRFVNLARDLVTDTPYAPGTETLPLTSAKFGTVRRFYIRTGKDKGVLPADQDEMIANNPPEQVFCMPRGDHAVFFSAPTELFRILTCIAGL